jgi:hypothetical protein
MPIIVVANKTVPWSEFYDEVLPYIRGVPKRLANQKIIQAAIDFCADTRIWQADHAPITLEANKHTYTFAPDGASRVVRIERAWVQAREIFPKSENELSSMYHDWNTALAARPSWYLQESLEAIRLVPIPDQTMVDALVMKASLKPARNATGIDAAIWERHVTDIANGALSLLFAMPDKPWTNGDFSQHFAQVFEQAKDNARWAKTRGFTSARISHRNGGSRFL